MRKDLTGPQATVRNLQLPRSSAATGGNSSNSTAAVTLQPPNTPRNPGTSSNGNSSSLQQREPAIAQALPNRTQADIDAQHKKVKGKVTELFSALNSRSEKDLLKHAAKIAATLAGSPDPAADVRKHLRLVVNEMTKKEAVLKLLKRITDMAKPRVEKDRVCMHLTFLLHAKLLTLDAHDLVGQGKLMSEGEVVKCRQDADLGVVNQVSELKCRASTLLKTAPFLWISLENPEKTDEEQSLIRIRDALLPVGVATKSNRQLLEGAPSTVRPKALTDEIAIRMDIAKLNFAKNMEWLLTASAPDAVTRIFLRSAVAAQNMLTTLVELGEAADMNTIRREMASFMASVHAERSNLPALRDSLFSGAGAALRWVATAPADSGMTPTALEFHAPRLDFIQQYLDILQDVIHDQLQVSPTTSARTSGFQPVTPAVQSAYKTVLQIDLPLGT